jgi:small conductance mechanosensitive channel
MEDILDKIYQILTVYGLKVLAALAVFIIGRWVAKGVKKVVERLMTKGKVDPTLISFTANLAYIGLLAFIIIAALGQLGIQTTSFIAIIGAAGLAIGLALQGSLSNFAAGFLLIIFRPFKVGDLIEGAGVFGVVEAIQIFTTQLKTADNKTVIVPNAKLTDDNIVNWTVKGTRRVDMVFGIGYEDDIDKARSLMEAVIAEDSRILKDTGAPDFRV